MATGTGDQRPAPFVEEVEIAGHIIDSLILPKVLDEIAALGGRHDILEIKVGQNRKDPSFARLKIEADSESVLEHILKSITRHGAVPVHARDCELAAADIDGAFPEGFYCTTNEDTEIRLGGHWHPVSRQKMDAGIKVSADRKSSECVLMADVKLGDQIVVGRHGVRVLPQEREVRKLDAFGFMGSTVSSEKPKGITIREIAAAMKRAKAGSGKILVVAGPAVIHTGSSELFSQLVRNGYVNLLYSGNALAAHDIEQAFFGTSLGVSMEQGKVCEGGHQHHLRAINRIRRVGGIARAVETGVLTRGIMYECVKNHVPFVLAGSIRDDGPLPEVITDSRQAQTVMRDLTEGVTMCLMIATTLHSVAVGNLLPARVKVVCVDINPATVTKLADRGSFQTVGLVTDVEPFLRVLVQELERPDSISSV
ncbi:MAG TPA: TIGR00300 family protein [Planctomycetaceae bacterium]|jgi:lysine-ketoglutarate reductase/saccharopine dehydrogenase-like protein (TIGR00300 family)